MRPCTLQTFRKAEVAQVSNRFQPAVSPTFRLRGAPERRFGATAASRQGLRTSQRWRIGNPRHGRLEVLEVCATACIETHQLRRSLQQLQFQIAKRDAVAFCLKTQTALGEAAIAELTGDGTVNPKGKGFATRSDFEYIPFPSGFHTHILDLF